MASSRGEAIGLGLERGLRIVGGLRQQKRQAEMDELEIEDRALRREDRQLQLADRQRSIQRQTEEDARRKTTEGLGALDAQLSDLQPQLAAVTDPNSPEARTLTGRAEKLRAERGRRVQGLSGFDPQAEEREFSGYAEAIKQGRGDQLNPKQRVQGMAALGINLADYRRGADGAPSRIGTAIEDVRGGMAEGGDSALFVRGANTMLAGRLAKGVGQPSPYGGTIVGKEVMQFVPVPGSTPEDPKMAAHLRVWVKGDPPKTAEEKRLLNRWRAANPTAPEGATGVYFAPATQGGGSGDNDLVSTFSMGKGFQFLDAQRQLEEWANDPAVAADIDAGVGQWDPRRFFAARGPQKLTTKEHVLPPDSTLVQTTYDARGNPVGNKMIASPTTKRNPELEQARLGLVAAQTMAAAALAGLRNTRGSSAEDGRQRRFEATMAQTRLRDQRTAASSTMASLTKELETAAGDRRKVLQGQLDEARKEVAEVSRLMSSIDKALAGDSGAGLADADKPPPKPGAKPGAAGAPKTVPGKPTVSNWDQ